MTNKYRIIKNPSSDPYRERGFTHRKVSPGGGFLYIHKNNPVLSAPTQIRALLLALEDYNIRTKMEVSSDPSVDDAIEVSKLAHVQIIRHARGYAFQVNRWDSSKHNEMFHWPERRRIDAIVADVRAARSQTWRKQHKASHLVETPS